MARNSKLTPTKGTNNSAVRKHRKSTSKAPLSKKQSTSTDAAANAAPREIVIKVSKGATGDRVFFFGAQKENGCLSNMFRSRFEKNGNVFLTVEHYFQYQKAAMFEDAAAMRKILAAPNPKSAKAFGRKVKNFEDKPWVDAVYGIVIEACRLKFTESEFASELRAQLLATGNAEILEASRTDRRWGIGLTIKQAMEHNGPWPGQNLLGRALQETRQWLRETYDEK
ncbi:DUF1768-domain-containing protein [Byssothecium circinans]|uniref:DUF1768-domain-containing protein n=1 Tax=Byssothecium circinans TaxID=147558 RepID=A0A6A5TU80_9PLEO|nr:DUF1768-domain-containing protein [Byssothecium circinans]